MRGVPILVLSMETSHRLLFEFISHSKIQRPTSRTQKLDENPSTCFHKRWERYDFDLLCFNMIFSPSCDCLYFNCLPYTSVCAPTYVLFCYMSFFFHCKIPHWHLIVFLGFVCSSHPGSFLVSLVSYYLNVPLLYHLHHV